MLKKFKKSILLTLIVLLSFCLTGCSEYIDLEIPNSLSDNIDIEYSQSEDPEDTLAKR